MSAPTADEISNLAVQTLWTRSEWQAAFDILASAEMPALWDATVALVTTGWYAPTSAALGLIAITQARQVDLP